VATAALARRTTLDVALSAAAVLASVALIVVPFVLLVAAGAPTWRPRRR